MKDSNPLNQSQNQSQTPNSQVQGHNGRVYPVGTDPRTRSAYSRRKKLIILGAALLFMIAGLLTTMLLLARSTPPAYQAWQNHVRQSTPKQLQQQAADIEAMLLGDLLAPLDGPHDALTVQQDAQAGSTTYAPENDQDWLSQVKVKDLGVDDQGRPIRSIHLRPREINTWLTANFESWLAYRDFDLPEQIHSPMVSMQSSVSTLYFTVGTGSVSQVFQADFKINLDETGMAGLSLGNLRAGGMPIPMDSLGQLASKTAGSADARVGEWVAKMQNVRFKPVVKLPDGLKGHLLDYQMQPDNSVIMTLRIERYRPSERKKSTAVAQGKNLQTIEVCEAKACLHLKLAMVWADGRNMESSQTHAPRQITTEQGVIDPETVVRPRKDRRQRSRVACEGLSCTLGRVLGLSCTGMRLSARGWCRIRQDDRVSLTLRDSENQLKLNARIAWVRKTGLFQYEAGMEFIDMSFDQKRDLAMMAQMAMPKLLMRKGTLPDLPTD